jgi:NDP-sugar pyrophosphorylase family protein
VVGASPKVLAPVAGVPFVVHLVRQLDGWGCRRIVMCTGYRAEQVERVIGSRQGQVSIAYAPEDQPMGTGGALHLALPRLDSSPVLVMNGDSFCRVDIAALLAAHQARSARVTMVVVPVENAGRYGGVQMAPDDSIVGFHEKRADAGAGWINAGVYVFDRSVIEDIPAMRPVSLETEVFPGLAGEGLWAFRSDGPFVDIGTPQSLEHAQAVMGTEGQG